MGMFDWVRENDGTEWQTKAFKNLMHTYRAGDTVEYPLTSFQFEIFGGPRDEVQRDSYATVINKQLAFIGLDRDSALPLVDYHGHIVPEETNEQVRTAVPDMSVVRTKIAAGQQLAAEEAKALLAYAESAVKQRETMRRGLSEAAGRNIDLHVKIVKDVAAERELIADQVGEWLKTGENAECFEDVELVAFIRTGK